MKQTLRRQNSAAMFLTHVSPASLLDSSSRRIRIELKLCRGSRLSTYIDAILSEMLKSVVKENVNNNNNNNNFSYSREVATSKLLTNVSAQSKFKSK
jgi:hypothetical protein